MSRSIVAALAAVLLLPAAADAAKPRPKALLEAHRHNTGGHDWHVQVEVNKAADKLVTVVVYSQLCGETGFTQNVPLGADGSFDLADVPLADKKGTWSLHGSFIDKDRATGAWSMKVPTGARACDIGGPFRAQDATGHFLIGNPYEYAPPAVRGNSLNARRMRALKYHTRQNVKRFDTIAKARKLGYELSTITGCPGMHHARKHGTAMWGKLLDPTAPQSLVYWCDADMHWTLAAFMYRADGKTRPNTYGRLMQWHKHGPHANWMTHLWLVDDPVSAFATCVPFNAFARQGIFTYAPYMIDAQVDSPCSDSAAPDQVDQSVGTGDPAP
jgi:hypothetical protein